MSSAEINLNDPVYDSLLITTDNFVNSPPLYILARFTFFDSKLFGGRPVVRFTKNNVVYDPDSKLVTVTIIYIIKKILMLFNIFFFISFYFVGHYI